MEPDYSQTARIIRLEIRMEILEKETAKQTLSLDRQELRLSRIEKIMWLILGAVPAGPVIIKLLNLV